MSKTIKEIAKHSAVYGVGDLLARGVSFFLIPVYTRYFSTSDYGVLELLELTSYVISFVLGMGICEAMVRYYYEFSTPREKDQVVSVAITAAWSMSLLGLILLIPLAQPISQLVFEDVQYYRLFYFVFASIALSLGNEIPLQFLRMQQKSVSYTIFSLSRLLIQVTLNVLFVVYFQYGILSLFASSLFVNVLSTLVLYFYLARQISFSFSWPLLRRLLGYGLPLIGNWAGNFILHFGDRFFLQRLADLATVGLYSLSYKFGFLLNFLLLAPFRKTWVPKQFEIAAQPNAPQTFARVLTYYCFVQLFLTVGICALVPDVISLIADAKFHSAHTYVPTLLLGYNFAGIFCFFEFGLLYKKRTALLSLITLSGAAINAFANLLLIPSYGAWGSAWGTVAAFFFLMLTTYFVAQRLFYIPVEFARITKAALVALLLFVACRQISFDNLWLSIAARGGVSLFFPVALLILGFYTHEEKQTIAKIFNAYFLSRPDLLRP